MVILLKTVNTTQTDNNTVIR